MTIDPFVPDVFQPFNGPFHGFFAKFAQVCLIVLLSRLCSAVALVLL